MYLVIVLIVYADVLIFLNTLVDYFLLLAALKISGRRASTLRVVLSALIGGLSSLYIFLPNVTVWLELLYKLAVALCMSAVCFGVSGFKQYLKNTGILFLITCGYAGVMFAFWTVFKPYGMVINNSVVYFNISPTILVVCTAAGYILFTVLWRIFKRSSRLASQCEITVFADGKNIELNAIVDTGNSIEDIFQKNEVIIADKRQVTALFGNIDFNQNQKLKSRYRILPCSTVSGYDTLDSYRCDSAVISCENKKTVLKKPLLAVSKTNLDDGYNAIINPKILR